MLSAFYLGQLDHLRCVYVMLYIVSFKSVILLFDFSLTHLLFVSPSLFLSSSELIKYCAYSILASLWHINNSSVLF